MQKELTVSLNNKPYRMKPKKKINPKKNTHRLKKIGLAPGTLLYMGKKHHIPLNVDIIHYDSENYERQASASIDDCIPCKTKMGITWVDVNGLSDLESIQKIGDFYQLHPLLLEDLVNTGQRPKLDEYENCVFVVIKLLTYPDEGDIITEHLGFVLGNNFVLSFQESERDIFDSIRDRIETKKGRIRHLGADYLLMVLMDVVIDHYFLVIETLGEKVENLENSLIESPSEELVLEIQHLKKEALAIRRAIFPLREVVNRIEKLDLKFIQKETMHYFRDLYDHTIQIIESVELYRDMLFGLTDLYMSGLSNKMNSVMKVLTIISTIFIPLTFIVGVYGMNFQNMPELAYHNGYYVVWAMMVLIFVVMLFYFKRKKWL